MTDLKNFPYKITINEKDWYEAQEWCEKNCGDFGTTWYKLGIDPMQYFNEEERSHTTWYFKNEKDFIVFSLRYK